MGDSTAKPRFYLGAPQEEALARLAYAVEHHLPLVLLTGTGGVGKSALIGEFAREQKRRGCLLASVIATDPQRMLWSLAAQWGLFPERDATVAGLWRTVADRLAELRFENRSALLLVDDLSAEADSLRLLRQLSAQAASGEAPFTIIATCDTGLLRDLSASFKQLVDLRVELEPWDLADTIQAASGRFTGEACEELQSLTSGIARQVSRLARFASLAATAERLDAIDSETLVAVHDDLLRM